MTDAEIAVVGRISWVVSWRPRDPLRWSRFRWLSLASAWAVGAVVLGGLLLFGGEHIVVADSAWAVYAHVAGKWGIRISGACVLALGLVLVAGLGALWFGYPEPSRLLARGLKLLAGYYGWCAVEFLLSGAVPGGQVSWVGFVTFAMLAALPLVLSLKGPPELVPRAEGQLIEAVIDLGGDRVFARQLAQRLYGGSDEVH